MPWNRYLHAPTPPAPARQAKIDTIKALVERRDYAYRDLTPSKGAWRVAMNYTAESIDAASDYKWDFGRPYVGGGFSVERGDFDTLVALFRDDLEFARHIHHLKGGPLRAKAGTAEAAYREATKDYGAQHTYLLRANLEGSESEIPRIREAILKLEGAATEAQNEIQALRVRIAAYRATVPKDALEAAAYLATVPRIRDRPKKE